MKKLTLLCLSFFLNFFSLSAQAEFPSYLDSLPTTAQTLKFCDNALKYLLTPMGYELNSESVSVSGDIAIAQINRPIKIINSNYVIKTVLFNAIHSETKMKYYGKTYLVIATQNALLHLGLESFNSSAKKIEAIGQFAHDQFYLLLSRDITTRSFTIDVSPQDLNLQF